MSDKISRVSSDGFEQVTFPVKPIVGMKSTSDEALADMPMAQKQTGAQIELSHSMIDHKLEEINQELLAVRKHVEYSFHEATNRYVIRVVDDATQKVLKEIPPEKLLDMAADTWRRFGLMVDERV